MNKKTKRLPVNRKNIPNLRYGIIHTQFGMSDGVSIVMKQIEEIMTKEMKVPEKNIFYLVGKTPKKSKNITKHNLIYGFNRYNKLMNEKFNKGYDEKDIEKIEKAVNEAKELIKKFIEKNKIDAIIVHNATFPENFIYSIALSRYFSENKKNKKKNPKYILWWHDSFLERPKFSKPHETTKKYLTEGLPGPFVDFIVFINSTQIITAKNYFEELNEIRPGYSDYILKRYSVVYNTTDTFIHNYEELLGDKYYPFVEKFLEEFKVHKLLLENKLTINDTLFCLQHTRIVERKRIDFAIEYCYQLLSDLKKQKIKKSLYFFISGISADKSKRKLKLLNKKLSKKYNIDTFFLVFAEENKETTLSFDYYPLIFARLGGITTYFSEIEGFGNNLLEVLASGLIPIIYKYPVYKTDIEKFKFKLVELEEYEIKKENIEETIDIIKNEKKRKSWINKNLKLLQKHLPHKIIKRKLTRAIIRRR